MSSTSLAFQSACPHASVCPGCPLIHTPYGEQLLAKATYVERALRGFEELEGVPVSATVPARRVEGYRTRAKLVVSPEGALGLYARGSHDVVDLPGCRVLHPTLHRVVEQLRQLGLGSGCAGVDLALIGERVMLTFIVEHDAQRAPFVEHAKALAQGATPVVSVALSRRKAGAVQLLAGNHELLWGDAELRADAQDGASFHYAAHGAFLQVHAETSAAIYEQIRKAVRSGPLPEPKVLELYAGSGALALSLSAEGAVVTAVESFAPACERMRRAAQEQGFALEVLAGDAAHTATALANEGRAFDVVLVNPPRRGLDTEVRTAVAALAPTELMYVSCNPSTLARDLAHFARLGYRAESLTPFDMMPLTDHVETLARLVRAEPVAPRVLFEQGALVATSKAPHERVDAGKEPSLSPRLHRVPGCEGAVPISQLPEEMSGVCLFARQAEAVAMLRAVADEAEAVLLVLAKGVMHKRGRLERPVPGPTGLRKVSARYTRLSVESGHSLIKLELPAASLFAVGKLLASVGHPVIGSPQSARGTLTHFKMRHGLSRPFVHCAELRFVLAGAAHSIVAELPGDLARVLETLRAGRSVQAAEAD